MKHLPLFLILLLMSCSTTPKGDAKLSRAEFKDIYFVTIDSKTSAIEEQSLWNVSFLYRFEDCRKRDSFPFLIRYSEKENQAEQVYSCNMIDTNSRQELENSAKALCKGNVLTLNKNFCLSNPQMQLLPMLPVD